MSGTLHEQQKKLLELLLDLYENSKTYRGLNRTVQRFQVPPEKVFAAYASDYADTELVRDFEKRMRELEARELIKVHCGVRGIEKLEAVPERFAEYYRLLQRIEKREMQTAETAMYREYLGEHAVLDAFCREQIGRLCAGKKAEFDAAAAKEILELCRFVLKNRTDILERELSVAVLGDSKRWEKQFRSRVCRILRKYGDYEECLLGLSAGKRGEEQEDKEDKREIERIILAEHHVYANPAYVYFKGNAEMQFANGQRIRVHSSMPIAFSTETIGQLECVRIFDRTVMTVENLTSFHRMQRNGAFLIFLSGYHNSVKQQLIRKLYDANPGLSWQHFGDIDPDGFYILEHLIRGTGISFQPVDMGAEMLEKYSAYAKPLTAHDVRKAEALLRQGKHCEVMEYMLGHKIKLEQEIISWMEG